MADFDPRTTIISEYANSPTLVQMIDSLHQQITPSGNFQMFYDYIWNIDTAQGFGLDILGLIINLPRQLIIPAIFGFPLPAGPYSMTDDQYRRALMFKAMSNIIDSSAFAINSELRLLADGRGNAFVEVIGTMAIQYTFYFPLEPFEHAIMTVGDIAMRGAGVGFPNSFTINPYFGFSEAESWDTFDQAVFASY